MKRGTFHLGLDLVVVIARDVLGIDLLALLTIELISPLIGDHAGGLTLDINMDTDGLLAASFGRGDIAAVLAVGFNTTHTLTQLSVLLRVDRGGASSELDGSSLLRGALGNSDGTFSRHLG